MKIRFEETFAGDMDQEWRWVHERPDAWKIGNGKLKLQTLPGTLWGEANNAHNFLLRSTDHIENGFATRVVVTNHPQLMGEQAGLIWYYDDDNYIKLVKESLEGVEWIVLAREQASQPELIDKTPISVKTAELRLVVLDGIVQGQFCISPEDGWQYVGECALVGDTAPWIGLFTHGGPEEIERWVEFKDFSILVP